jgi:thiol-disulfide isomerase/thioredoxin
MPHLNAPLNALDPALGWINSYVHVHDLIGYPVLLHFWSIHCEQCVDQLPELKQLIQRIAPRGLKVVGVHVPLNETDLDTQVIEEHVQSLDLHYPIAVDDASAEHSITLAHDVRAIPAYLVFDREGLLRHFSCGADALVDLEPALDQVTSPEEAAVSASPY